MDKNQMSGKSEPYYKTSEKLSDKSLCQQIEIEKKTDFLNEQIEKLFNILSKDNCFDFINTLRDIIIFFIPERKQNQEEENNTAINEKINKQKNSRIKYSYISGFIYNNKDNDKLMDNIKNNLALLCIDYNTFDYQELKFLSKVQDHIDLCFIQHEMVTSKIDEIKEVTSKMKTSITEFKAAEEKLEKANSDLNKASKTNKDISKEIDNTKNEVKNLDSKIFSQVLSIVSVFTGLAFIIFGGLSLFSDLTVFFKGTETNLGLGLVYLSVIGLILLGLIYLFFNFIVFIITNKISKEDRIQTIGNNLTKYFLIALLVIFIVGGFLNSDLYQILYNFFKMNFINKLYFYY